MDVNIQDFDVNQCAIGDFWFADTHQCNRTSMEVNSLQSPIKTINIIVTKSKHSSVGKGVKKNPMRLISMQPDQDW